MGWISSETVLDEGLRTLDNDYLGTLLPRPRKGEIMPSSEAEFALQPVADKLQRKSGDCAPLDDDQFEEPALGRGGRGGGGGPDMSEVSRSEADFAF